MADRIQERIVQLEREISALPEGSIARKTIRGRVYHYRRFTQDGVRREKYIDGDCVGIVRAQIEERRELERELKILRAQSPFQRGGQRTAGRFRTVIKTGEELVRFAEPVRKLRKRECFEQLRRFVYGDSRDRVFILYGLRRTGKTTMIRQLLADMDAAHIEKTAFIQISAKDTLAAVNEDLRTLENGGYEYVFVDEVTLMDDFIGGAALFSDVYATCGMKIVLSGTDSLGFVFAEDEQLYDRCFLLHTTFIPYREFENVLGLKGIDEYIRYGGTMSLGGIDYDEGVFADDKTANDYVDTAIAKNIQHSLRHYQDGGHMRHLADLHDRNELTSAVNRVVEDINHRFTVEVLTRDFKSNDLALSARNLRRDRTAPDDILDTIDYDSFIRELKRLLEILDKREQTVKIEEAHAVEIKEYLHMLDLIYDVEKISIPYTDEAQSVTVVSQPGMRYAQAEALIRSLLMDKRFGNLSSAEKSGITSRILSEISGRMMEEIVLLETKLAQPEKHVFKLQFAVGEFDMVVEDTRTFTCEIYEIKYGKEIVPEQYRHLTDEEKCEKTERRFGKITGKHVIYRGEDGGADGVSYLNVENYLKGLRGNRTLTRL